MENCFTVTHREGKLQIFVDVDDAATPLDTYLTQYDNGSATREVVTFRYVSWEYPFEPDSIKAAVLYEVLKSHGLRKHNKP